MQLTPRQMEVLTYLRKEDAGRQKTTIARALDTGPDYVKTILTELRKMGLVDVSSYMGWWSITEAGKALVDGDFEVFTENEANKPPFLSEWQVNNSYLLRVLTTSPTPEVFKNNANLLPDDVLEFIVGLYLIKHEKDLPRGRPLTDREKEDQGPKVVQAIKEIFAALTPFIVDPESDPNDKPPPQANLGFPT